MPSSHKMKSAQLEIGNLVYVVLKVLKHACVNKVFAMGFTVEKCHHRQRSG
ncbi:hypothetical protein ACJ72_06445 [Emergomyces africanus]|uniref:Uncharacterized protein n=1 Tax=Emergomyces africanus TaxID=1955775 RepID=A0A1B7NQZ2_9EURO|nr:hypothetical protein ACJ72_06445 [Emergomyces africanus]